MDALRIVAVIFLLIPSLAFGAITRVQSKATSTGAGAAAATLTITLTSNATVGNTLIVSTGAVQNMVTVKYGSNTWGACSIFSGLALCYIPVREVSNTIVVTPSTSSRMTAIAVEYSGTLIAEDIPPLLAQRASNGTTNPTGTLAATTYANELIFAAFLTIGQYASEQTAWLTSLTNSFVSIVQTSTSSNVAAADRALAVAERFVTSTGTYSTSGTQPSQQAYSFIASFVDNPGGCTPGATATPSATATATATPVTKAFTFGN